MSGFKVFLLCLCLSLQLMSAKAQHTNLIRIPLGKSVTLKTEAMYDYTYRWYRNGVLLNDLIGATLTTNVAGEYQVVAINERNCESEKSEPFIIIVEYADLEVYKKSEIGEVLPEENFEYTITAKNNGNSLASNVMVTDVLPSNLVFVEVDDTRATFENGMVTWRIASLDVGQIVTLKMKVQARFPGVVSNTANILGNPSMPDPNLSNNASTDLKRVVDNVKIPNVITPNGDGLNDVFKIEGIEHYRNTHIVILNRWGSEVFNSGKDYKNNWDGYGLNEGTYFYSLKLENADGKVKNITGWVTILRDK